MHRFTLAETLLCALPSGALFWPEEGLLCVSDLHLGKSERLARRGGSLLPPYETRATLERLQADIEDFSPQRVVCLGDSFDDLAAAQALEACDAARLAAMMAGREWTWIEGNHDAGSYRLGGTHLQEFTRNRLSFRHIATQEKHEISGHYHPKVKLAGQAMRCFLSDAHRLILPAYGAYTGGIFSQNPVFTDLMQADALAFALGKSVLPLPMPR